MTRYAGTGALLLVLLSCANAQVADAADLPLPHDYQPSVRPPTNATPAPPYIRDAARASCRLALSHPPFPRIPFYGGELSWLEKCIQRFTNHGAIGKAPETLVCELRNMDVVAEASRNGIGVDRLPPRARVIEKCESAFRSTLLALTRRNPPLRGEEPSRKAIPAPSPPKATPAPEPQTKPRPYNPREREAVVPVQPAPAHPKTATSPAAPPSPPSVSISYAKAEGTDMEPLVPAWVLALILLVLLIGALFLVLALAFENANQKNKLASHPEKMKRLRQEREALRVANDIEFIKEQAELRPLVLDTKKAILQGKADKRLLDAVFARRALDDVLGLNPQHPESDPIEAATRKIIEEIESRKADGQETSDLEHLLRGLRGVGDKVS